MTVDINTVMGFVPTFQYGKGFINTPWRSQGTQFNHSITRDTLNRFEVTRDLLFMKDANGNALFNGADFNFNGMELPSWKNLLQPGSDYDGSLPSRSGHPNGFNHPQYRATLEGNGWIGRIEADWQAAKTAAAAMSDPNAAKQYLQAAAESARAGILGAQAVLRRLQPAVARINQNEEL